MKKIVNTAFLYLIYGLCAGVFYREYTKFMGFNGQTTLASVHPHILALGVLFFLVVASFLYNKDDLIREKTFSKFYRLYNVALVGTTVIMLVRGIVEVDQIELSKGLNASISGLAGLFHILTAVALYLFFKALKTYLNKIFPS